MRNGVLVHFAVIYSCTQPPKADRAHLSWKWRKDIPCGAVNFFVRQSSSLCNPGNLCGFDLTRTGKKTGKDNEMVNDELVSASRRQISSFSSSSLLSTP